VKLVNIILSIIFIVFLLVQYNDPDPYFWMFVYGVTALLCMNAARGKSFRMGNIGVIVFCVIYILLLIPDLGELVVGSIPSSDSEDVLPIKTEILREFFGLLITIFTMFFHLRTTDSSNKITEDIN